jgi:hypothetical protein
MKGGGPIPREHASAVSDRAANASKRSRARAAFAGAALWCRAAISLRAAALCRTNSSPMLSHTARRRRPQLDVPKACATVRVIRDDLVTVEDADVTLRVEDMGGRRRRISGGIDIDAPVSRVWHVLTQYTLMDKYMPNITQSLLDVKGGEMYLDQIGLISRKLGLKTRMVMRVTESPNDLLAFSRVSGRDFSEFEGRYFFSAISDSQMRLDYEVVAVPMPFFPVALVERKIVKEVPGMLASVRGEAIYGRVVPL